MTTPHEARTAVQESVRVVVPDADFGYLDDQDSLRSEFELDSLDFLTFVEALSKRTGRPITEDEYPRLATMTRAIEFLTDPRD